MHTAITFRCRSCGTESEEPWKHKPSWARVAGFDDCVEWAQQDIWTSGEIWPRLEQAPQASRRYLLRVEYPFRASSTQSFWTLFLPALSALNGLETFPDDLDALCLVECELTEILTKDDHNAWIRIHTRHVIPINTIAMHFEPDLSGELPPLVPSCQQYCKKGDLRYRSGNFEGDVADWLIWQENRSQASLLLYGTHDCHTNFVYAGNRSLRAIECDVLKHYSGW